MRITRADLSRQGFHSLTNLFIVKKEIDKSFVLSFSKSIVAGRHKLEPCGSVGH